MHTPAQHFLMLHSRASLRVELTRTPSLALIPHHHFTQYPLTHIITHMTSLPSAILNLSSTIYAISHRIASIGSTSTPAPISPHTPINFKKGYPAEKLLQYATKHVILPSSQRMWETQSELDVLPYIDNLGLESLRRDIVKMFNMTSVSDAGEERLGIPRIERSEERMREAMQRVMITSGCSQGVFHVMTHLRQQVVSNGEKPLCLVEEPTYFIMPSLIEETGWRTAGTPMSLSDGIDLDALEERLIQENGRVKALYTVPIFQNPSGVTIPHQKRQRLIALARKYDFYIIADEVYQLLHLDGKRSSEHHMKPLAFYDEDYDHAHPDSGTEPRVLSMGSFSKIVAPGIKLGYVLVARGSKFLEAFAKEEGLLYSGGGNNPYTSGIMHQSIQDGSFVRNLEHVKESYAERLEALHEALQQYGAQYFEYRKPSGGYFFWVRVKLNGENGRATKQQMEAFMNACEKRHLLVLNGGKCCVSGGCHDYLRLCFGWLEVNELEEGVRRLVGAVEDVIGKQKQ